MNDKDRITQLEAACAAMREGLMWVETFKGLFEGNRNTLTLMLDKGLSSDAGKSLLDRLQAVEKERDRLRIHVIEFLNDWKKGDFQLSELAACDARAMEEALQPAQKDAPEKGTK